MLRRSARLISLQNRYDEGKPGKDLVSVSKPPMNSHRKFEPEVSKRRSLRLSNMGFSDACKEKSPQYSYKKPPSTSSYRMKSTKVSSSRTLRRSPRFSSVDESVNSQSGNRVLSRCSNKSISSERGKGEDCVKFRVLPKIKQMFRDCNDEEEVSVCLSEKKRMRLAKPKRKNKIDEEWTEELELVLQEAYLKMKPSPNFWKKVSKMVPGKSAQECFDKVNLSLITPRQPQPPARVKKTNLSTIPQFSISASKLLKPNSPKTKIQHRRKNLSKKTIRHLLEKKNHIDQDSAFDLFSVLEPGLTSNFISTPMEKRQSLPKIVESPRSASKDQTTLVSPPVLKQVKNKALHEKYIDHLHMREAKRKADASRLARKENIRPIDIQKKNSVRAAKDAIFFDVEAAIQKLKGLEAEKSSSSSEFSYEEDESI